MVHKNKKIHNAFISLISGYVENKYLLDIFPYVVYSKFRSRHKSESTKSDKIHCIGMMIKPNSS